MSINYIIKITFFIFYIFLFSCQDSLNLSLNKNKLINNDKKINIEKIDKIEFTKNKFIENAEIDYYSSHSVNYNFLEKNLKKIKINNYEGKIENDLPINIFYSNSNIYSINSKAQILKFDVSGKLIERILINSFIKNKKPVSFSLIDNDFIIGFKSGKIIRLNKLGNIIWSYQKDSLLNFQWSQKKGYSFYMN